MKARSVARELALFILFQREKKGETTPWDKPSLQEMIVQTVRALTDMAQENITAVCQEIAELKTAIEDYEIDHPDNAYIPLESPTKPVPIPTTKEMMAKLETLLEAVENLEEALLLPEVHALSIREDVQNYCYMLVKNVLAHQAELDAKIDAAATDWRIERFQKMDRILLRLALGELMYANHVEPATIVDEVLELAKRFTTDESRKFIHGILGAVTQSSPEASSHV